MAERRTLNVNGRSHSITVDDPDMPLPLALRENLNHNGPLFRLRARPVWRTA